MKGLKIFLIILTLVIVSCDWFMNEPPTCIITNPLDSMTYEIGEVLPVSVEAEDPDGKVVGIQYYINNVAITSLDSFPWTYPWNTMGEDEASYTIKAIAYDNDDDSKSDEITIFLENSAPVAFFTVDSTHGHTQSVFRFDATKTYDASDDSSTLMIRWDWTNDGTWDTNYSTERLVTHQYENPGTYTIRMEVKDSYDLISQMTLIIHVEPYNSAPTAKFHFSPESPEMETVVTFDASESFDLEDDAQSLEVRWDFENDGTWDTGYLNTKIKKYTYSEEGSYIVKLEVRDSGGLTDVLNKEITVLYKNQSPTAVIECTPPYGDTQTLFTFSAAKCQDFEDDTSELEVRWDWESDGEWDTGFDTQKTITHRYSKQGTFTVTVEVRDTEELSSTTTKDVFVSDYNSAPTAKFTISPETGDTETLFTFDASPSFDPQEQTSALQVRWDWESDGEWDTGYSQTKTITHQFMEAGSYRIKMEVIDSGELTDTLSHALTVNYKNEAPTASFVNTPEHGTTETLFHFDASASHDTEDPVSALQVRWDWENDGMWDTGFSSTKTATHSFHESATYTVKLEVKDSNGGTATTVKDIFVADYNSAPSARFTYSPETGNTETVFTFDASTSFDNEESSTNLQVRWDWENDGTWDTGFTTTKTTTHRFRESGTYTIKLEVKDSGGLTSTAEHDMNVSHKNTPPTAVLTGSPNYGTTETIFTFDVSGSSDLEDNLQDLLVRWDWENDGTWDTGFDTSKTISYSFLKDGNYTVKVEVRDTEGLSDFDTKEIFISKLNTAPYARFTISPESGDTETLFTFDASGSYDNEENDEYLQVRWDWESDGIWDTGYSTNKIATHRYDTAGTFRVMMEIRDSGELTDTVSQLITVSYKNTAPIASIQCTPGFGNTETIFTFNASGSSDKEDAIENIQVRWDFENDGAWNTDFDTSKTITHTFPTGGTYTVKLEVIDTEGLTGIAIKDVIVADINTVPIPIAEVSPLSGNTRTDFTFDASRSYDKEDATNYLQVRWDFENDNVWDTEYSTSKTTQFRYKSSGAYQAKLRVRDRGGLTSDTLVSVTVEEYVNTAPIALFLVDPTSGPPETLFHVDASSSYDHEDELTDLQVRWDWENDGIWDTGFSYKKTASHLYDSDGTYTIKLEIRDSEGLTSTKTASVVVSSTNNVPIAVIASDANSGDTETVFSFDASGSSDTEDALATLEVRWDWESDGSWDTGYSTTKTLTHTFTTAGNYTVTLEVRDTDGATAQATKDIYVSAVNTAPVAVLDVSPETGDTETTFTFDASGSYDMEESSSSLQVRWDYDNDGTWDTGYSTTQSVTRTFATAGTYTVQVQVVDSEDLRDTASASVTVSAINQAPVAVIASDANSGDTETVFSFDASGSSDTEDALATLEVRWDWESDGSWDTGYSTTKTLTHTFTTAGNYTVTLEVRDTDGATAQATKDIYVEFANTAPTAVFTSNYSTGNTETIFTFDASDSYDSEDNTSMLEVRWDWEGDGTFDTPYHSINETMDHRFTSAGTYNVTSRVKDSGGLTDETSQSYTITEYINNPPSAGFTVTPESGYTSTVFEFDASASVDLEDGQNILYVWDWDDDGSWDTDTLSTMSATHRYPNAGVYTARLKIIDTAGLTDEVTRDIYVEAPNTSPIAAFTSNYSTGTTETVFTFDASNSYDAEDMTSDLQVRWDWNGDGTWDTPYDSATSTINHRFITAGTYNVTVRVKDSGGLTDETSQSYTITEYINNPPSAGFTVTPESGYTSTVFEFDASESWDYENGNDLLYLWDWDDDDEWDTDTLSTPYVTHRYDSAGSYKVKLLVIDSGGLIDSTYHWYLEVSSTTYPTPTAIFTVTPTTLNVGDILTVDASESFDAEDKYDLEYRWDWEDDGTWDTPYDTSKTETHSYDSTGEKIIRLEVRNSRDEVGTDTEKVIVQ